MKKVLFILFALTLFIPGKMSAQWFVEGTTQLSYVDKTFVFALEPAAGYEFNEKWAVAAHLGFEFLNYDGDSADAGTTGAWVRFTPWNIHETVFFDVKAKADFGFTRELETSAIGLVPSIRFRIKEHWDVAADLGLFGTQYNGHKWVPAFGVSGISAGVTAAYLF